MARREPVPAAPEVRAEGPFRVVKLYGDGPPLWACYAAGERRPRLSLETPDLAYLLAAGMEIAERPRGESPVGPVGSIRRHQVQYKARDLRRGRVYSPMACLTGFWREDAGFPYGQQFQVEVEDGRLVLQAV
jgi:hypothetical protein